MSRYRITRLLIFFQVFSLSNLFCETPTHFESDFEKTRTPRTVNSSDRKDDWCYGHLNADEKRKIQEEIANIYSKYQGDPKQLQESLERLIQNNTGTGGDKRSAEITAMAVDSFRKLNEVSKFSAALTALTKGEKIKDRALAEKAEALKGDFEKLKALGFKFDPEKQNWDLSEVKKAIPVSGDMKEIKQAVAKLISPDFAEKLFDPDRKETLSLGGYAIRPPHKDYSDNGVNIVSQEQQDRDVQEALKRFSDEKKAFLEASKKSNTYWNSMTGRAWELLGWKDARGPDGKTAPEHDRDGAYKGMLAQLNRLKDTMGVKPEAVGSIISSIQNAVSLDSAGLEALDRDLTQKISALQNTAIALGVIGAVAVTGGLAAPGLLTGALATSGGAAATTGVLSGTTGALGIAMGTALSFQAIPAAINVAIDTLSGKSLSCAAMDELFKRGPNAVAATAIAGASVSGFGAAGSVLSKNAMATAGLGAGVAFTGLGTWGAITNASGVRQALKAAAEAEARGDKETAAEIRREALKRGIELGLDVAQLGWGLKDIYKGARELKAQKNTPEPNSPAQFRRNLVELNDPKNAPQLARQARENIEGGTLLLGDIHHRPDLQGSQALDHLVEALPQLRGVKRIVVGGDIIDSKSFRGSNKTPSEIADEIVVALDRIHKASGISKENIIVGLGNHDAPTEKVSLFGWKEPERVINSEIGKVFRERLLEAGYTVGSTSPELSFRVGEGVSASHIPIQDGPNFRAGQTYSRTDVPGGVYTPNLPQRPKILPPDIHTQVNFDTHNGQIVSGPHRVNTGAGPKGNFTTVSVPTVGGFVSESPGNFAGVVVLGRDGVPYGWRLSPGKAGAPATLTPHPIPTRTTDSLPPGLDEANGIVVYPPLSPSPKKSAPVEPPKSSSELSPSSSSGFSSSSRGISYEPPKPIGGTTDYPQYRNYNDAMRAALAWANERGRVGALETGWGVGKLAAKHTGSTLRNQFKGVGPDGETINVRIERHPIAGVDGKPLNHINISYGKEDGPHFIFPGNEADLNAVLRQLAPVLK